MSDEVKTRKPRGPRSEYTIGDLRTLKRFGKLDEAVEANKGNPAFTKALRALAGEDSSVASAAGLGEGEVMADKRNGIFVSTKGIGGVAGSKIRCTRVGETLVLSLA